MCGNLDLEGTIEHPKVLIRPFFPQMSLVEFRLLMTQGWGIVFLSWGKFLTTLLSIVYIEIEKEGKLIQGCIIEWIYSWRWLMLNTVGTFRRVWGVHLRTASPRDETHLSIDFHPPFGWGLLRKASTPHTSELRMECPVGSYRILHEVLRKPRQETRDLQCKFEVLLVQNRSEMVWNSWP